MPTWQGAEFLERCLDALAAQTTTLDWDFLAIDSGSTDGTLEILDKARARFPVPLSVESIHQAEFDHGDTRNLLAARSRGELLVFLTQDAIPVGDDWLERLVRNFDDPEVGALYCRNVPRPDCEVVTSVLSAGDPGYATERKVTRLPEPEEYERMTPDERRLLYNFNDVASALRRELWERCPFPRTQFGEDVLLARNLLEAGYAIVYEADAAVEHSHDYGVEETRKRARIDGRFSAEWLDRTCIASEKDARTLARRLAPDDERALRDLGLEGRELAAQKREAHARREAAFLGLWEGGRTELRRPASSVLEGTTLHVLFVVHGFPPDTWAGTEIYTLTLAKALVARGHRCTVLTRAPASDPDSPADFEVTESEFEGLRVLRMAHRLDFGSLRESYDQPRAEEVFRKVLVDVQPDLVHFQHLLHLSASLVHVAKEFGLPTIVHCHDYWAICARVQLIRPDGERCERNMGAGCLLCVKDKHLDQIPRVASLGLVFGPLLDGFAASAIAGKRGSGSRQRWDGYTDLRARQEVVLGAFAAADLLVSPSQFLRDRLLETKAFDPARFVYSDNGLRTDHVEALEKIPDPERRIRFGFVGSLVWYKGVDVLVRAMGQLADQPVALHVHGAFDPETDEHHAELEAAAGENVRFHGRFDNSRLSEVYAEIDVLVVPSVWFENSPITIHEAHLTRTPVVTSDIGGMAEYVRDGVDGLHFRVGDPTDLARVLRRFVEEPDLVSELSGDWPRIKTIDENAAETEFRYRALVAQSRPRREALRIERFGFEAERRFGPTELQGADMALMRPGGAAIEFDLPVHRPGSYEIGVEVLSLGGEQEVELAGRVLVGSTEIGRIEPFCAGEADEQHQFLFRSEVAVGDVLRIETRPGENEKERFLRVSKVRVSTDPEGGQ